MGPKVVNIWITISQKASAVVALNRKSAPIRDSHTPRKIIKPAAGINGMVIARRSVTRPFAGLTLKIFSKPNQKKIINKEIRAKYSTCERLFFMATS